MQFMLVLGGVFALACVVFALQNNVATTVTVFVWRFDSTLAVVLLLAFIAGALSAILLTTPAALRARVSAARQRRAVRSLTEQLDTFRREAATTEWRTSGNAQPVTGPGGAAEPGSGRTATSQEGRTA